MKLSGLPTVLAYIADIGIDRGDGGEVLGDEVVGGAARDEVKRVAHCARLHSRHRHR